MNRRAPNRRKSYQKSKTGDWKQGGYEVRQTADGFVFYYRILIQKQIYSSAIRHTFAIDKVLSIWYTDSG